MEKEKKHLLNEGAARIGCVVSLIIPVIILLVWGLSILYYFIFYAFIVIPIIMISTQMCRYFTKTQAGAWFGAAIGTILGFQLLIWFLSKYLGSG